MGLRYPRTAIETTMPRNRDMDQHFDFVRKVKALLGVMFGVGALISVYAEQDTKIVLGLAIMAGMMLDAPSVTKLVSVIVKAIPWSKNGTSPPTEEDERP